MTKFLPIIHLHDDGTEIFRTDMVNIQFEVEAQPVVMTFNLEETCAPPIPFAVTGVCHVNGDQFIYVVDKLGGAWCEDKLNDDMRPYAIRALSISLASVNDPNADRVIDLMGNVASWE